MTRRRKRLLVGIAIGAAAIVAVATAARKLGPGWLHRTIESSASRFLGRELSIAGSFDVSFSLTPKITARDVSLANAASGSERSMVRARRVMVVVDLVSLWWGPVRLRELEIDDARLLLERGAEGRGNWVFTRPPAPHPPRDPSRPLIDVDHAAIRGLELVYRPRSDAAPVELDVEALVAQLDPVARMIDLQGNGHFEEEPWELAGRIGTLERIRTGHDIDQALAGRLGDSKVEIRGRLRDLFVLGGPDLDVSVEGPDLAKTLQLFGSRWPPTGAFRLHARLTREKNGVGVDAQGLFGGVDLKARGVVSALAPPARFDIRFEAAGPNAATVGSWLGVQGLSQSPFELAGRLRRTVDRLALEEVTGDVGTTSFTAAGALGTPPRFVGTDLTLRVEGRDLSELSALVRLRLPPRPFELAGRLLRRADGLAIDAATLRFQRTSIRASGPLGEPPDLRDLNLTVEASGPDLALFSRVAQVDLPQRPFTLRGGIARDGTAFRLEAVQARVDDIAVEAAGRLVPAKRLVGSDFRLRVAGPDLASLASLAGLGKLPAETFDVRGRLRVEPDGYRLDDVEATVGGLAATGAGRIAAPSVRDGTSLSGRLSGASLADLAVWGLPAMLPAEPFSLAGGIRLENGVYHAAGLVASVGSDRARLDGVLGALPDLSQLDVAVDLSGPSLAAAARFLTAAGLAPPWPLPAESYSVAGRVRSLPWGYELREVRGKAGNTTTFLLDGTVAARKGLRGTDLRLDAEGSDTSLLSALTGIGLPAGAFEIQGQLARDDSGFRSDGLALAIGEASAQLSGTLGAPPGYEGTDLRLEVAGPDLAATFCPCTGIEILPAKAFALSIEIAGDSERFASKRFDARLGGNDLSGHFSMRLEGRPTIEADLRSRRFDIPGVLAGFGAKPPVLTSPVADTPESSSDTGRLIPDAPLTLAALGKLDVTLRLAATELVVPGIELRDVTLAGELRDGALRFDQFEGTGIHGGHARANFALEPLGDGYRVRTAGRLEGGRLVVSETKVAAESAPPVDLEFDLGGEGRSLHEIAASSTGHALAVVGSGRIPTTRGEPLSNGRPRNLLDALTPLRKTEDYADVECGIALATVAGGKVAVEPIAVRTDKMTVTGRGKLDFDTEEIDLSWALRVRKGVGLSPGEIANSYVQLRGTLASPRLELKPLEALTSMGATVATGGLTTVAKAIWGRITAGRNVCERALKDARRRLERLQESVTP